MPSRPGPHVGCHVPFHAPGCPDWVADGESFPPRDYVFTLEVHVLAEDEEKARRREDGEEESGEPVREADETDGVASRCLVGNKGVAEAVEPDCIADGII